MNTEITDSTIFNGWVLYDGNCRYCCRLAECFRDALLHRQFKLAPLQSDWVRELLHLEERELLAEMRLLKASGQIMGGADALLEIGRQFWWLWPIRLAAKIPGAIHLLRAAYRWVARRRYCVGGACELRPKTADRGIAFLPALVFPLPVLFCQKVMAPWVFMWAMAFALYAGCKWITYCLAAKNFSIGWRRKCGYLLAWPGMDAAEFLNHTGRAPSPRWTAWAFAAAKTLFGGCLLWYVARMALPAHPLLAGWIGMVGAIFILHFGLFHLASLAWRAGGVNARPVMRNPLQATSLADFWGVRWNTAFNELAFRLAYRPLRRATTRAVATLGVFGLSGLVHELVISLPAHGGYGLPTLYFLAQGIGMLAERSSWGRIIGLGRGLRGWIFTLLVTAGPAFWLFHPPFIHNVILPMLTAIGAT